MQFGVDYFPRTRGISTLSSNAVIVTIIREMLELRADLQATRAAAPEVLPRRGHLDGRLADVLAPTSTTHGGAPARRSCVRCERVAGRTDGDGALLVVNADDYGLTEGVSRAILTPTATAS